MLKLAAAFAVLAVTASSPASAMAPLPKGFDCPALYSGDGMCMMDGSYVYFEGEGDCEPFF